MVKTGAATEAAAEAAAAPVLISFFIFNFSFFSFFLQTPVAGPRRRTSHQLKEPPSGYSVIAGPRRRTSPQLREPLLGYNKKIPLSAKKKTQIENQIK